LQIGRSGAADAADDNGEQSWVVLCYDASTGRELWRRTARKAPPRVSRHQKATHANTTAATDGRHLVAFFGSEGLYCYDRDGKLLWERDLGVINISKYGISWGYGSSPTLYQDRIAVICDDPQEPFLAVLRLSDGEELWRVSRKGDCERSWGAPMIHADGNRVQVVANGWPWIVSYDLETGEEIWRLAGGGDNPIPTPFEAHGWIYVTNAHGGKSPIYAVRPTAKGDITPTGGKPNGALVWSSEQCGSYISTPVIYRDRMYFGNTNGVVRCYASKTGEMLYEERLDPDASLYASLVAADGKVYCPAENGTVYVLRDGPKLEIVARNPMGAPCFATPAVSKGVLYFRTTDELLAIA
jgi:outer membrane protein assembly factor BamB